MSECPALITPGLVAGTVGALLILLLMAVAAWCVRFLERG